MNFPVNNSELTFITNCILCFISFWYKNSCNKQSKAGMSEDVVADYLGITKGSLSMIERGHDNLRLEYAVKLSKLYKCTVDDICRDLGLL